MFVYFAVDTETTGLKSPWPIEIGACKIEDVSISFCEKIKTEAEIEPGACLIHGITKESLSQCQNEDQVLTNFLRFLNTNSQHKHIVLVAHNAKYDKGVIERALKRHNLKFPPNTTWECTMELSKSMDKLKKLKHSLRECCHRIGVEYKDSHSALPDAQMCAKVFQGFFKDPCEEEYQNGMQAVYEQEIKEWKEIEAEIKDYRIEQLNKK